MTRIRPPPFIPPWLVKLIPSLAPTKLSELEKPPHLMNILSQGGKHFAGRFIAQRRRLIQTGTADLFYKISKVEYKDDRAVRVKAYCYYRGYPVQKIGRWLNHNRCNLYTWDFVSARGRLLAGSDFTAERDRALKLPGLAERLKDLAPGAEKVDPMDFWENKDAGLARE